VADEGFPGIVIKTTRLATGISVETGRDGDPLIHTGASVGLFPLLRRASAEGWGGLEFLAGIPGCVGGAIAMNAGTHLGETKDRVLAVHWVDRKGEVRTTSGPELKFAYRKNLFLPEGAVVIGATWSATSEKPTVVAKKISEVLERRKDTQPVDIPNCGSVFVNPPGHKAWQIIEKLGLRGARRGAAQISEKHANFIVNHGNARASDVLALIQMVIEQAQTELGITMVPEVKMLGF
jgi:UDP-N-acetylmuramate dehydrogenase